MARCHHWICYHRLRRWPQRLIAVGDAVCVFNPVYDQGLTVAAQEAQLLGELLDGARTLTGLAPHFQRRLGCLIRLPWATATSSDLAWDLAPPGRSARLIRWYLDHLLDLIPIDPEVATRFSGALLLTSAVPVLADPQGVWTVAQHSTVAAHMSAHKEVLVSLVSRRT